MFALIRRTFLVTGALTLGAACATAAPIYRMTIPEPVAPYDHISVGVLNNRGDTAARMYLEVDYQNTVRTFIRASDGQLQVLPIPPALGWDSGYLVAINDAKQAIYSDETKPTARYFWDPIRGWVQILPPVEWSYVGYHVTGLNQKGDVVGYFDGLAPHDVQSTTAFSWTIIGGFRLFKPDETAYFVAVNSKRQVASNLAFLAFDHRPPAVAGNSAVRSQLGHDVLWVGDRAVNSGRELRLADKLGYSIQSAAYDINEAGAMAVTASGADLRSAMCVWRRKEELRCLDLPDNASQSLYGIGGADELLYVTNNGSIGEEAHIWRVGEEPVALKDALEPGSPAIGSVSVGDINESGVIRGGVTLVDGTRRSAIFTPLN